MGDWITSNWAGVLVAFAVGVVGYFNWVTSYQKIIVDLFERRFAVYEELRRVISIENTHSYVDDKTFYAYVAAKHRAQFLFGPDVTAYLQEVFEDLKNARRMDRRDDRRPMTDDEIEKQVTGDVEVLDRLGAFYDKGDELFAPYMRMHQRLDSMWWPFSAPISQRGQQTPSAG
jgi:hypothetical protein